MPKFAATLASLLLIASSIGVNIARYPQVGRSVEPAEQVGAAETANSTPVSQQSDLVETANPDALPGRRATEPAQPSQAVPVAPLASPPVEGAPRAQGPAVAILDVRAMVPVAGLPAVGGTASPPTAFDEVRRLPPIELSASAASDLQETRPNLAEPYPATSTP